MKRLLLLITALGCGSFSFAQLLTWTPPFPTENNASQTLVITMDATKGNQGLLNYSPTSDVYVHIGVITNKSASSNDWKYVPFTWATTPAAGNAAFIGNNKWTYTISGSLRSFFGITDGTETIQKIAILFRSGNGSKVQRNADASDMYIPVYTANLAVRLSQPPREPKFVPTPEPQTWTVGNSFSIAADASKPSAVKLYHNGTVIATSAGNVTSLSGNSIVTAGNQQIVAEANDGTTTKYDTMNIFVSQVAPLPAGVVDGINYNPNNTSVTLVLRAPGKGTASVIGDFNNWTQSASSVMNKTPDGKYFWLTINGLTPGTEYAYQYVVDGSIKVADPYAEKVLAPGPFADAAIPASTYPNLKPYPAGQTGIVSVLQIQQPTYNWSVTNFTKPDKRGLVIYEMLLRDYIAAHDWKTLKDTLSYLKRLGVNAIEVMPWTEFEGNNSWGYNTYQYFAPDKYYGPKNTLKEFIDSCHKNGIAVIMDIVLNHTYGPSPLAQLYYDAQNNRPAADNPWYNAVAPHAFGFGEDFNHDSQHTKDFFNRVLQHWITEYKIDGYRVDFSKGLTQRSSSNDGAFSAYDASRIAIINGYANTIKAVDPNSYIILEHFCADSEEKELTDNGMMTWANVWTQYQEASMGYLQNSNFDRVIHTAKGFNNAHLVGFMESHDEERVTFKNIKYGNSSGGYNVKDTATALKRMALNAAFMLTIPGPKMIWQFGEVGYDYSRCYLSTNGEGGDCDKKLDPKPIRWDYKNETRRQQVFTTYSELNRLRNHPWYKGVFQSSTIERSLGGGFKWIKLTTANDTADLVVIGNFDVTAQTGSVTFPIAGTWYDYFGNFVHTATGAAQSFTLQPGEFHVYVNRNVNNLTTTPVANVPWAGNSLEVTLFPNPVTTNYTIEVKLPQSGVTKIELYNSVGQYINTVYKGFLGSGTRTVALPKLNLPKGSYFLKVQWKDKTKTIPLTLQ